jgi:hypothetical protein
MRRRRAILAWSFVAAVLFMGLCDVVSTMLAAYRMGGFEYETSVVIRVVYDRFDLPGFFALKMIVVTTIAYFLYRERLMYALWGMAASGFIVSASNLNVFLFSHSLLLFGMEALYYSLGVLVVGMLFSLLSLDSVRHELEKIRHRLIG